MYLRVKNRLVKADKKIIEEGMERAGYTDLVVDVANGSINLPDIYSAEVTDIIEELAELGEYIVSDGENETDGGAFQTGSLFDDE